MKPVSITPFLWFEHGAEAAAKFYVSVFENSSIVSSNPMVTVIDLNGLRLQLLNGGPMYKLNESFSLSISCDTQEQIDYYWDKLTEGGKESMCGWLVDQFGLSWQVVPSILGDLMNDPTKSQKVIAAFMQMKKFDLAKLMSV